MKKIVWLSDIHLGLKTSDIDRTEEIVQVSLQAIKYAVKLKKKKQDVIIVIGGDIFEHNHPNDELIAQFIRILNPAVKAGIKVFVLVGNHDSISNPSRKSCFSFLKKLKGGYEIVKVIDDIKTIRWHDGVLGEGTYLTFFPHITKAHIDGTKYKTTQDYIDGEAKRIWKKVGQGVSQYVFSHLNVHDLVPGSEENLLKQSEVWFPESFYESNLEPGQNVPLVMQGHIHTRQRKENLHVVGSPIFCAFGEKEKKKYFAVIHVPEKMGEKEKVVYKKADCRPFLQFDLDFTKNKEEQFPKIPKNAVVKLNVTVSEEDAFKHDWEKIRKHWSKACHYVKPITPYIIRKHHSRNADQKINLSPMEATKVWMKTHKPKNQKRKLKLAKEYIEGVL